MAHLSHEEREAKIARSPFKKHLDVSPVRESYRGTGKLEGKAALITGGDSGIGRSVAIHFAMEGADIAINYHHSDEDAKQTQALVVAEGRRCILIKGDVSEEDFCRSAVQQTVAELGALHILINNAGTHEEDKDISGIDRDQLLHTFAVNTFSAFYLCKAALEIMEEKSIIINTASVVAYRGSDHLLDYSATKGALVAFTRSLAANLAEKKIRVNGVAPGPVWTPLVISTFPEKDLAKFGRDTPLGRAGYSQELGPAYVFLACDDSSFITGQVIHVNGGEIVNT